jgi:parallel beta-helix repeat protein
VAIQFPDVELDPLLSVHAALRDGVHGIPTVPVGSSIRRTADGWEAAVLAAKADVDAGIAALALAINDAQGTADAALPLAGGTLTGPLTLSGDAAASLQPVTKQQLDATVAALINGAPGTLDTLKEIADRLAADQTVADALAGTVAGKLGAAANLSDLVSAPTARGNLGLGTAATANSGAAGEAGKVLKADDATVVRNAKSYGAVGDGIANDTAALQAAIDASVGGRLVIPPGRYKITASLLLPSNIIIDGDGAVIVGTWADATGGASKGSTYIRNADSSGAAEQITVRNLEIEGPGTGAPSGAPANGVVTGILGRRIKGFRLWGVRTRRIPGISVAYQGCTRVRILSCEVVEGGRDGITGYWYVDPLTDIVVANNTVRDVGDDGIAIQASTAEHPNSTERPARISINGNTVYGDNQASSSQAGRGIVCNGVEDTTITGNAVSDTFASGIAVNADTAGSSFRSRNVTVTGNSVRRAAVWNDGTQPTVGIRLTGVDHCAVGSNTVSEAAGDGIYLTDATACTVGANTVDSCGTALGHFAIHIDGQSSVLGNVLNCAVTGNTVVNNTGGIRCNYAQKPVVMGNLCVDNGRTGNGTLTNGSGIILSGDKISVAIGNVCYDTRTAGSRTQTFGIVVPNVGGNPGLVIESNFLSGNAGAGLSMTGVTPAFLVKRGNVESASVGSALNYDQDVSGGRMYSGTGSPNEVVEAPIGSMFRRTDGGAATVLYVKESGTGKSGWVAK